MALVAGALTAAHLDQIEGRLAEKATGGHVRRTVDTDSVAKFELSVQLGAKSAPVAVTIYKDHKRVRIQILTHDLNREEIEALEDTLAQALDAKIVDRSDPEQEASAQHAAEHAQEAQRDDAEKSERRPAPPQTAPPQTAPPR
jgi:hypothetical protein